MKKQKKCVGMVLCEAMTLSEWKLPSLLKHIVTVIALLICPSNHILADTFKDAEGVTWTYTPINQATNGTFEQPLTDWTSTWDEESTTKVQRCGTSYNGYYVYISNYTGQTTSDGYRIIGGTIVDGEFYQVLNNSTTGTYTLSVTVKVPTSTNESGVYLFVSDGEHEYKTECSQGEEQRYSVTMELSDPTKTLTYGLKFNHATVANCEVRNVILAKACRLTKCSKTSGDIVVPERMSDYEVVSIDKGVFQNQITSVSLPKGITDIEELTFSGCSNLVEVHFPDGLKSIGPRAFSGCTNLSSVNIPESVTTIGYRAFASCSGITSINIPEGVTSIEESVFNGCSSLPAIHIPEGVTSIGQSAFEGCSSLTDIALPQNVTTIGERAFYGCTHLISATIPKGIMSISNNSFSGCKSLTSFSLPEGLQTIGASAFSGCEALKRIDIPEGVTSIGASAFSGCDSLCYVSLYPSANMTIGAGTFYSKETVGINGLTYSVAVPDLAGWLSLNFPDEKASPARFGADLIVGGKKVEKVEIPSSVERIGDYTLTNLHLTDITIPASVKHFGAGTWNCTGWVETQITDPEVINASYPSVSSVYIPAGTKEIYAAAEGWKSMTLTEVGSNWSDKDVVTIHNATPGGLQMAVAMLDVEEITNLKLTGWLNIEDVKYIRSGIGALESLRQVDLSEVQIVSDEENGFNRRQIYDEGQGTIYLSDRDTIVQYLADPGISQTPFGIPTITDTYCSLGAMFAGTKVERVALPNGMNKIPAATFMNSSIVEVRSSEPIIAIHEDAFSGCSQLVEIDLTHVKDIRENAFRGCTKLRDVGDISKVQAFGKKAFYGCSSLTEIQIGEGVKNIPYGCFYECGNLRKVVLPSTLKEIEAYSFLNCLDLQEIVLPEGLITLGQSAFSGCTSLSDVTIPASVVYVGQWLFESTPFLSSLPFVDGVKYADHLALTCDLTYFSSNSTLSFREGTTSIADGFIPSYGTKNITAIEFPNTLRYIGKEAFKGKVGIKSIVIPESVDSIGAYAFADITTLNRVTYNAAGTAMGEDMFYRCTSIERVTIGPKVQLLPGAMCSVCSNLLIVNFQERSADVPLSIGRNAFSTCPKLQICNIPESTVSIGEYAFYDCSSLATMNLPNGVTSIGGGAFYNCSSLTSFTIPESVTSIGSNPFSGCSGLTSLTSLIQEPFEVSLGMPSPASVTLYVPRGTKDLYEGVTGWTHFKNIEELPGLATGYYRIRTGLTYTNNNQVRDKYMMAHKQDGKYWAIWGSPEDYSEETQDIRPLFKVTNLGDETYDIVSAMYDTRFTNVTKSTSVEMTPESTNVMAIDEAGTLDDVTYYNIRVATQDPDDYFYLHQNGHKSGQGIGSYIVGWCTTFNETTGIGASEWLFEKVDDSEAKAIIATWQPYLEHEKALRTYRTLYAQAEQEIEAMKEKANRPLITDITQLTSPCSDNEEGVGEHGLQVLIDGITSADDSNNFWHSDWHGSFTTETNQYLQVELAETLTEPVFMQFSRRKVAYDHITKWSVYGTDVNDFQLTQASGQLELLAEFDTPYKSNTETIQTDYFDTKGYKYLRFYCENGTRGNRFFHLSEFNVYLSEYNSDSQYTLIGQPAITLDNILTSQKNLADDDVTQADIDEFINAYNAFIAALPQTGDLDCNGQIDADDVRFLTNVIIVPHPAFKPSADLNGDSRISIADLTTLIKKLNN